MNYKMIGRFLSQILAIEAIFMVPALIISYCYSELIAGGAFLVTIGIILAVAAVLYLFGRGAPNALDAREGMICVGISWIVLSLFGCLPAVISKEIPRFIDSFFETVSGFTTTGSSILNNVEALSPGILYWRSFTQWLGGMGVLVFLLAIAPGSKDTGFTMHLLRAESPGPEVGKLVPRMRKTATILYVIYIVMTLVDFILLLFGDMHWLEALCTAFGTAGTGGLGIKNDSMASYSAYIQYVTAIFMFLFGINFSCYYLLLLRQFRAVVKDEELRTYFVIVAVAITLIVVNIYQMYGSFEETFRNTFFTVTTIVSTTGYGVTDHDLWPAFSKGIVMFLMLTGACAGSTSGGLKISRLLYLLKSLGRNITQILNPRRVKAVRYNGRVVSEKVLDNTNAYLAAYVAIIVFSYLIISLDNNSVGTNFTAVLACFNNIGPGLEAVGPTCNFSHFSDLSKLVLSADMLAGRLEIFPILVLFSHSTWKR